jgi:hypothetical protein
MNPRDLDSVDKDIVRALVKHTIKCMNETRKSAKSLFFFGNEWDALCQKVSDGACSAEDMCESAMWDLFVEELKTKAAPFKITAVDFFAGEYYAIEVSFVRIEQERDCTISENTT